MHLNLKYFAWVSALAFLIGVPATAKAVDGGAKPAPAVLNAGDGSALIQLVGDRDRDRRGRWDRDRWDRDRRWDRDDRRRWLRNNRSWNRYYNNRRYYEPYPYQYYYGYPSYNYNYNYYPYNGTPYRYYGNYPYNNYGYGGSVLGGLLQFLW
jgi:hypothetical protein